MPDQAAPTDVILPAGLLARWPHLPVFWPGRTLRAGPQAAPVPFALGPFSPPRLGGREVPVAVVTGDAPDPLGAALARKTEPGPGLPALLASLAARRIGGIGWPDPGGASLGLAPRSAAVVLGDVKDVRETGSPVIRACDPFRPDAPAPAGALRLDPWTLLDIAAEIHGASRELALLALAAGVRVADGPLAGADPLASWAALLAATRCADPFRQAPCGLGEALDLLELWTARAREGRRVAACLGMHPYKREGVTALLGASTPPVFSGSARRAIAAARDRGGALLAWSASAPAELRARAEVAGVGLLWLEDGFIRSAGLGAAFRPGASFALDTRGPYYDPARESDLERLLNTAPFPPPLLARAAALRAAIVERGITKYNLRGEGPDIAAPAGRRVVLVPGQVEDDASVRCGGGAIRTNLELLRRVRADQPDAFILYKPHPDIAAGFRRGRMPAAALRGLADGVVTAPMHTLLARVDAVHTLTSLTGFEALLRGVAVTCWGTPFYAGWGLTEDRAAPPRPRRRLALDELVAGALILYPRCVDPVTALPCPPEVLIERLDRPELFPPGRRGRLRAAQGLLTRAVARLRGLR